MKQEVWTAEQFKQNMCKQGTGKKNKYNNKRIVIDGIRFDSLKEGKRYQNLKLQEKMGMIRNLVYHKIYQLTSEGQKVCKYEPDFCYDKKVGDEWKYVVEDVKSSITKKSLLYKTKKRLMFINYGIEILET